MPKRRRKDSIGQTPKKHKQNGLATAVNHFCPKEKKTGKRCRPRTKQLRKTLVDIIEANLTSRGQRGYAVRQRVHYDPQIDERPYIYLDEFLSTSEELTDEMRAQIRRISKEGLLKMNNLTTTFELDEDPRNGQLVIYCGPTDPAEECTVFVTNIPRSADRLSLSKLLVKFGKVADVTFPVKKSRFSYDLIRPKNIQIAKVQFTEIGPAREMIKKYADNLSPEGANFVVRKPKPHKRKWRKIIWRDAMITKRRYETIRTGASNGLEQKKGEEHRRRSGSNLKKNKSVVRKRSRAGKDMFNIEWPALRKRLKERRKRRNYRKKKRLMERKAKRAAAKAAGNTLPKRIRFRRRRRLRPRLIVGSVDSFFSAIEVYSESAYYTLQTEYRRLQQARLTEKAEEYKNITGNGDIEQASEKKQLEYFEKYVDQQFEGPSNLRRKIS